VNIFLRCISSHKHTKKIIWGILHGWSKNKNSYSLWCTGQCPVPRPETFANWPLSGFLSARQLKFIGLSGAPPDYPVRQQSNDQLRQRSTVEQSDRQKSEDSLRCQIAPDCPVCHRTVRCHKKTEDFNGQQLQTPTVD
jgi:hypothetical protein